MKNRNMQLDIAKGIGILLVVWAHARGPLRDFINAFHMPMFFLISGYLFNSNAETGAFIGRKVKSLYVPFVFWNIFTFSVKAVIGLQTFTLHSFFRKAAQVLMTTSKEDQFMGATWFLGTLFLISVLYKFLDSSMDTSPKARSLVLGLFFIGIGVLSKTVTFPQLGLNRTLELSMYFAIGRIVREHTDDIKKISSVPFACCCFAFLFYVGNKKMSSLLYVFAALFASYGVIAVSGFLAEKTKYISRGFSFLGKKSIHVLLWHFVTFRFVIALQLLLDGKDLYQLLDYYPCYRTDNYWWVAYVLVGIIGSLLIGLALDALKTILIKLFSQKRLSA